MEIDKIVSNNINKVFETAQAHLGEQEEIQFAGNTYPVHVINLHYSSGIFDSGFISLEDGSKWQASGRDIRPAYFINWKTNDRVIVLDSIVGAERGYPKFFYNLENGEVCKVYQTFR